MNTDLHCLYRLDYEQTEFDIPLDIIKNTHK